MHASERHEKTSFSVNHSFASPIKNGRLKLSPFVFVFITHCGSLKFNAHECKAYNTPWSKDVKVYIINNTTTVASSFL